MNGCYDSCGAIHEIHHFNIVNQILESINIEFRYITLTSSITLPVRVRNHET